MSGLTCCLLLLAGSTIIPVRSAAAADDDEFFKRCPPSRCGGLEIRYPLRLSSASPSCGPSGLGLSCSANRTILSLPSFGHYAVSAINYMQSTISAVPFGPPPSCPFRNLTSTASGSGYMMFDVAVVNCSTNSTAVDSINIAGPIACLSDADHFAYLVSIDQSMEILPSDCVGVSANGHIPWNPWTSFGQSELNFQWLQDHLIRFQCEECEYAGGVCGFSWERNRTFCSSMGRSSAQHGSRIMLITGTCLAGVVVLVLVVFILVYTSKESVNEKETRMRVERFLATYNTTKPTRYSFTEIKKITKHFKHKLGQGGFGTVYKGELSKGIPVAVKMLEKSKGKGEEFTNEVATIGRIHHVNIVRLLGFCSEGTRHALVYEFMSNESLEKYIPSKEAEVTRRALSMEKFQDIALGIAQGIEYLHQGCDRRILHFDIKPHNILLDHDLNPKISDFGLAKLCSKDISIVTMTAARGTMGYIAPEIYSRNFGTVSSKSDVYSFGMLLMDMVGGRESGEPASENQSSVYFPETVYNRLTRGTILRPTMCMDENQEEIAKKLSIVALWCIQWSPVERPSMSKVVKMLEASVQSLEMPPKPFASTSDQDNDTSPVDR